MPNPSLRAGGRLPQARLRVERARHIQEKRFRDSGFLCNAEIGPAEVWKAYPLDDSARGLLQAATQRLNPSAKAFHRILKVSRTIADRSASLTAGLDGAKDIVVAHPSASLREGLAETLQYRSRSFVG